MMSRSRIITCSLEFLLVKKTIFPVAWWWRAIAILCGVDPTNAVKAFSWHSPITMGGFLWGLPNTYKSTSPKTNMEPKQSPLGSKENHLNQSSILQGSSPSVFLGIVTAYDTAIHFFGKSTGDYPVHIRFPWSSHPRFNGPMSHIPCKSVSQAMCIVF